MIHAVVLRLCGNRADADDVVQEVFLQAFRKWHLFRGDSSPGTWLHVIAVRACRRRLRQRGSRAGSGAAPTVVQLMPWHESTVMEVAASAEGAEGAAERAEALARVQREIVRLPDHLRLPLVLKDVAEMSVADTAEALGLAENTVKTRVHRARLALRKAMAARASSVAAPAPIYDRQVCMDLLKSKLAAMDRGGTRAGFRVPQGELCARCRAVFRELDLVQEACSQLAAGELSPRLRKAIAEAIERSDARRREKRRSAPGRRPVERSVAPGRSPRATKVGRDAAHP